jgi:putative heme transporter
MTTAALPRLPSMSQRLRGFAGQRWCKLAVLAGGVALAAWSLRGHLPSVTGTWTVLRGADPAWLAAAALVQVVSMAAFAQQQRHLLSTFGVRMRARTALAVSYARSAMSTALPAGSAVSAAYAFRQYRAHGATPPIAAAVTLLSALASVAGLALLSFSWFFSFTALAVAAALTAIAVACLYRPRPGADMSDSPAPAPGLRVLRAGRVSEVLPSGATSRAAAKLRQIAARWMPAQAGETMALARQVPRGRWIGLLALAAVNWALDLGCLLAALHAVGLNVTTSTVATAYLLAQLARQIPATPGGIGVVEAGLIVALTGAGAAAAPAAAAVLVYRLLSCWAVLPIGLACWTAHRAGTPALPTGTAAA